MRRGSTGITSLGMDGVENSPQPYPDDLVFSTEPKDNAGK